MIERVQVTDIEIVTPGSSLRVYGNRVGTNVNIMTVAEVRTAQSIYNLNGDATARLRVSQLEFDSLSLCTGVSAPTHVHEIEYDELHPVARNVYPILSYRYCKVCSDPQCTGCIIRFGQPKFRESQTNALRADVGPLLYAVECAQEELRRVEETLANVQRQIGGRVPKGDRANTVSS